MEGTRRSKRRGGVGPSGFAPGGPQNKKVKLASISSLSEREKTKRASSSRGGVTGDGVKRTGTRAGARGGARPAARTATYAEAQTSEEEEDLMHESTSETESTRASSETAEDSQSESESEPASSVSSESSQREGEGEEEEKDYTDVHLILSSREREDGGARRRELLVKWKDRSYIHASWEPEQGVDKACARTDEGYNKQQLGLRMKVKNFRERRREAKRKGVDLPEAVDQSLVTVERVLDHKMNKITKVEKYLVKWQGLGYGEATWEEVGLLQGKALGLEAAVEAWRSRGSVYDSAKEILGKRKDPFVQCRFAARPREFNKYEETPEFLKRGSEDNELYAYQLEGLNWLEFSWQTGQNVILGDEMGLGKTVQAISLVASLASRGCARPHIVVAPLSTLLNWQREAEKWAPQLNVVNYSGTTADRKVICKYEFAVGQAKGEKSVPLERRVKCHLILTTYEMVNLGAQDLCKLSYGTMIVDEGHRLKNRASKLFGMLKKFKCEQRVILTGTPLQNNLEELFMLMHFIDPKKFTHNEVETFLEDYENIDTKEQIEELHNMLKPHLLRRMKNDVLGHLPPKKEQIVLVEMSHEQKEVYKALLRENFELLSSKSRGKVSGMRSLLMDLRKCCQHPSLITKNFNTLSKRRVETFTKRSGKLHLLWRMLEKLFKGGHRVLIYSQFVLVLDMVQEWLEIKGINSLILDGSVKGKDRQDAVDAFNQNEGGKHSVFLLSTKAGGLGINLATADTVIIFDSDWNPHNDIQAQARAHRLGQSKEVMIYRLVMRATVEERMVEVAKRKMVLEHLVVSKGGREEALKQEEIDDVIRYGVEELFQKGEGEDCPSPEDAGEAEQQKDKLKGLAAREAEAGREGGNKGKGVYYDDEALDRLLDRSLAYQQDEEEAKVKESQHLQAFKVANFEIQEGNFWEDVMQEAVGADQGSQPAQELGKGKREKRRLSQSVLDVINNQNNFASPSKGETREEMFRRENPDIEYDPSSEEEEEDMTETEGEGEDGAGRRALASGKILGGLQATPWTEDGVEDDGSLMIAGFNERDRKEFHKALTRFGLIGNDLSMLKSKMPHKSDQQIDNYGKFFMKQLVEVEGEGDNEAVRSYQAIGIDLLAEMQILKRGQIVQRIADIQLIRDEVESKGEEDQANLEAVIQVPFAFQEAGWTPAHDLALFRGVLKHGFGNWKPIVNDETLISHGVLPKALPDRKLNGLATWVTNRVNRYCKRLRQIYSERQTREKARKAREEEERKRREMAAASVAMSLPPGGPEDEDDVCVIVSQVVKQSDRGTARPIAPKPPALSMNSHLPPPVFPMVASSAPQAFTSAPQGFTLPPVNIAASLSPLIFTQLGRTMGVPQPTAALQSLFLSQLQRQQQQTTMQQAMLNHIQAINENIRGGQGASQGSVAAQLAAQSAFFNAASNK